MIFKRKNVLCSNCGFLGWLTEYPDGSVKIESQMECNPIIRESFQKGKHSGKEEDYDTGGTISLHCYRSQWTLALGLTRQSRQCRYYVKYHPGYIPAEHKELIREARMRRAMVIATLLGASVGALAAIVAGLLFNL